ncbi:MAG: phosphoribosyltransferase [Hadesarchaea archaeon]|nr:MAG: phosphoribosyltransferase [Hadesarchaea archaeon]TDA34687.1 MAG: phosphoribosyltransferase [Hadesarchaea archaeon]
MEGFLHLSWGEVQLLCERLSKKIVEAGYRPDLIVAVSRGGFPVGRILCDLLGVEELASVQVKYYRGPGETGKKPELLHPPNVKMEGRKVLVVDDVADTGHSLAFIRDLFSGKGEAGFRVATLHYKPWSIFKPDFYVEEVREWVVYPWEVRETILKLVQRLRGEGKGEGEIISILEGWGFERGEVEEVVKGI